jgi:hypothetical protein
MALQQITGNEIAPGSIEATDLSDGSITGDKLGLTAINANNIVDATITGAKISSNTISNTAFQTGSVENYMREANLGFNLRNRIINGAMAIDQRNAGAAITPGSTDYTVDRWHVAMSQSSKFTTQQDSSANTVAGFASSLKVTSLSSYSSGASDYFVLRQAIEGLNVADLEFGTANARPVTLSFWVRSSLTGTFGGSLYNGNGSRSYTFSYTIVAANTWEQKTITIPGDTTGTWVKTNAAALYVSFSLGAGSDFNSAAGSWAGGFYTQPSGATSVVGTNGATFYITGVQLEVGSTATSFDYRPYGTELVLCQRYALVLSATAEADFGVGACTSGGAQTLLSLPVTMRAAPTITYATAGNFSIADGTAGYTCTSLALKNASLWQITTNAGASGTTGGRCGILRWNTGTATMTITAEL